MNIVSFKSYLNHLDEQFVHLQIQPPPPPPTVISTPISYPQQAMINPHIQIGPYNHLPPAPYPIANGPTFYQPSPQPTTTVQQPLTTPYHPHPPPQIVPGLPPHAPIAVQRTVNFTTNDTNNYHQQPQRLSPNSIQTQEINLQALQQRLLEQQTPISIQRQMNRLPTIDYSQ